MRKVAEVEQWFYKALEKPPETRKHYLDTALKNDPDVLRSVLQLLEYDQKDKSLFTRLMDQIETDTEHDEIPTIERYTILEEISRGGMAVVYLAERMDGLFDQNVAVKVLKSSMVTEDVLSGFQREKNLLAKLQHASIAQIFDAGIASDGRPYLVMEYIDGRQLPEYLHISKPNLNEKLKVFSAIADAVHSAHQQLIIHGDIKPSNILIRNHGDVKLTDFGIARLQGEETLQKAFRLLTPEYASPEQIRGEQLDTRSDIYQLGKVLNDLVAENMNPVLGQIIDKATADEKTNRYQSVEQLKEDINNFMNHKPVSAIRAGHGYRIGLYLRRNRWTAIAISTAISVLIAISTLYVINLNNARTEAEQKEAKANETLSFLIGLFEQNDPSVNLGDSVNIGLLLDAGLIRASLLQDTDTKAALYNALGKVELSMGNYDEADSILEMAHQLYSEKENGAGAADVLISRAQIEEQRNNLQNAQFLLEQALTLTSDDTRKLTVLARLSMLYDLSNPNMADYYKQKALNLINTSKDITEKSSILQTYRLTNTGYSRLMRVETDSVITYKRKLISSLEKLDSNELADLAWMLGDLARIYSSDNRYDSSLIYARKSLSLLNKIYGPDNIYVTAGLQAMAQTHGWNGNYDSARFYAGRSLHIKQKWFGIIHHSQLPERGLLAQLLINDNHFEKGEEALRTNYKLSKAHFGSVNKITGDILFELLQHLNRMKKFDESILLYPELISIDSATYGMSANTASSILDYGQALNKKGRRSEALIQFQKALSIYRMDEGSGSFLVGMTLFSIAKLYKQSEPETALNYMDSAIVIIEKDMPANHPRIGNYQQQYASLLAEQSKYDLSNSYYIKAIENYRINYSAKSPRRVARFLRSYAGSLEKQGLSDSARIIYDQAALLEQAR